VRKANGASRMRCLIELSDSTHLSLFVTPFEIGNHLFHPANVDDDEIKFSRTHLEFKKQIHNYTYLHYEIDTIFGANYITISHIDTTEKIVSGLFQCKIKNPLLGSEQTNIPLQIRGKFSTVFRD
jgi:hypothetical protein